MHINRTVRPKYAAPADEQGAQHILISALPRRPIDKCINGANLLTTIIVGKHVHHTPIDRRTNRCRCYLGSHHSRCPQVRTRRRFAPQTQWRYSQPVSGFNELIFHSTNQSSQVSNAHVFDEPINVVESTKCGAHLGAGSHARLHTEKTAQFLRHFYPSCTHDFHIRSTVTSRLIKSTDQELLIRIARKCQGGMASRRHIFGSMLFRRLLQEGVHVQF